jgi:hypothetical protein
MALLSHLLALIWQLIHVELVGSRSGVSHPSVSRPDEGETEGRRDWTQLTEAKERGPHQVRNRAVTPLYWLFAKESFFPQF